MKRKTNRKTKIGALIISLLVILSIASCNKEPQAQAQKAGNSVSTPVKNPQKEAPAKTKTKNVVLVDSGYSIKDIGNGNIYVYYGATVNNPNKNNVASYPKIQVTAKDASGAIVGTNEQVLNAIAPEDTVSFGGQISCNGATPSTVEISADCSNFNSLTKENVPASSTMKITNTSEIQSNTGTSYTGEIENTGDKNLSMVAVTVILKNNGKIVYGQTTFLDNLNAGTEKPFQISAYSIPEHTEFAISSQVWG